MTKRNCFAIKKDDGYEVVNDVRRQKISCTALMDKEFSKMRAECKCGTSGCPFFKPNENVIRLDKANAIYFK